MSIKKAEDTWRIRLVVPHTALELYEAALEPYFDAVLCFEIEDGGPEHGKWVVDAYSDGPYDKPAVSVSLSLAAEAAGIEEPAVTVEHEPPRNWLAENLLAFPPIQAGRFFVHGSHWAEPPPEGTIALQVDASTAFGSGEHQSTYGCLLALDRMAAAGEILSQGQGRALDMGCGSGILGLALARCWGIPVVATDIDEESTRVAHLNAEKNGVSNLMTVFPGDGFTNAGVQDPAPYNVICANILARPLCEMASDMAKVLAPGGRVILAGLLINQENMVLDAYRASGLCLRERIELDPWVTLVLEAQQNTPS
ncbi:50S ribosomal protein L11 methyltransferase [Haematospirillum sp. H1815]|uniref:50S ribosomal protein L11 methyltransferase n=1 Tax=Haematospirillum sp. H1815 TaxID=2723108 RepID=UPI001438A0F5|nr:50S ribosomal protein L11 methyltransferase [Haematospirillum sp. H1815]NKD77899.1 50S ribosomal protein L11 methyltransferase [Haematospirillum sp. H1815]